jgi:hypothetical protein
MQIGWVLVSLSIFDYSNEFPGCCFSRERNESRRFRRNSGLRLHQRRVQVPQQLQPDCPEQLPLRRKKFRVNSFKEASLASGHELFKTLPKEIFLDPKFSIKIFPFDVKNNRQRWGRIKLNALVRDYLSLFLCSSFCCLRA